MTDLPPADLTDLTPEVRASVEADLKSRTKPTSTLPTVNYGELWRSRVRLEATVINPDLPGCPCCNAGAIKGRGDLHTPDDIAHNCNCVATDAMRYRAGMRLAWQKSQALPLYLRTVPPMFQASRLSDPELAGESHATAMAAARQLDGTSLYLYGVPGCHKSRMAAALGRAYAEMGMRVKWYSVNELINAYRDAAFGRAERPTPGDCEVLILDDPGKCKPSGFAFEQFFTLLDHAYTHRQTLIVTAQDRPGTIAEAMTPPDANAGAVNAVASRLGKGAVIEVTGRDDRYNSGLN